MWDIAEKTSPILFGVMTEISILAVNTFGFLFITHCVEAKRLFFVVVGVFFVVVVVAVSVGLLSALCLPGSTFTKLPTPYPQAEPSVIFIQCLQSAITPHFPKGELLFKQHSHIIMDFFYFFWDCPYSLWISTHSHVFIQFGLEHLSCHRVRGGERTGRTCLSHV